MRRRMRTMSRRGMRRGEVGVGEEGRSRRGGEVEE